MHALAPEPAAARLSDPTHSTASSFREKLLEHVFVGQLLCELWRRGARNVEVLRAEVDHGGYDLVLECNGILRYIQFKSSHRASATADVSVSLNLSEKPGGCVLWIHFDPDTLELGPFLWFGGAPGEKLPALGEKVAKHSKGDRNGVKKLKPNHRVVSKSKFERLRDMDAVISRLFGLGPLASQLVV